MVKQLEQEKQVKNVDIQERDKQVFLDCCRFKGLTKQSISERCFEGNYDACHQRLNKLRNAKYIDYNKYTLPTRKKRTSKDQSAATNSNHPAANNKKETTNNLNKGNSRLYIYHICPDGQKAINYKPKIDTSVLTPNPIDLNKYILLSDLYTRIDNLISSSETHVNYNIANIVPVLCSIATHELIIVTYLNKEDMDKTRRVGNIKTFIKNHTIKSTLPARIVVTAPSFPKELIIFDFNYLPLKRLRSLLVNITNDNNHYKRSFQKVFLNSGYLPITDTGLYWQVTKDDKTYKISELITGSTELMRTLMRPDPNTYIYIYSRSHLYGVNLDPGYSFLVFSWKDSKTYKVTKRDGHHFEEISKEVLC